MRVAIYVHLATQAARVVSRRGKKRQSHLGERAAGIDIQKIAIKGEVQEAALARRRRLEGDARASSAASIWRSRRSMAGSDAARGAVVAGKATSREDLAEWWTTRRRWAKKQS